MPEMTGFLLATALLLLTPGPTNTLLAMAGGERGFIRSLPLILAEITGYLTTILPVTLFAAAFLADNPRIGGALKLASAAWVLYLAIKLWKPVPGERKDMAGLITSGRVYLTTVLNPKALIIGLVLMPQGGFNVVGPHLALFAATVLVVASLWIAAGATLIRAARLRHPLAIPRVAAVMLCLFSGMLLSSSIGLV
ncbi:hypothetical protein [Rhizobium sp. RU36D]|uniref:LysE family translocator n=1 Tax=Rhizobium sp. RU36D TaxID=1907415 RepID=UPI0009D86BE9|nr:hypothetical protein [Rhizobium sp. RU36D]SMD09641.1 Threonine/homoserine/homoserine lactone efflux protein [Rhizobium sp. RU36D]